MLIVGCWQLSTVLEVSSAVAALTRAGQVLRQFREPRCCLQPRDSSSRDVTTQLVTGGAGQRYGPGTDRDGGRETRRTKHNTAGRRVESVKIGESGK